jgi:hypothetical protein
MECIGGKYGRNVVFLTNSQYEDLLTRLGLDAFNLYLDKLSRFIIEKEATIHNHYGTILKWYEEDARIKGVKAEPIEKKPSKTAADDSSIWERAEALKLQLA